MRNLNELVVKVKPISVFRPVRLIKVEVMTAFGVSCAKERKGWSQGGFLTAITTCDVKNEPTVCGMVQFKNTVIHRVIGRRIPRFGDSTGPPVVRETILFGET